MSLLHEDHLVSVSLNQVIFAKQSKCWEMLSCDKALCPAHGKYDQACWLIPGTHCSESVTNDLSLKLSTCLTCTYFRNIGGENNFKQWHWFISEQLHQYNLKSLESLYHKEEGFIEILNRIPDGLFTTDREWRITFFNPAAESITGFSASDAIGMYCKDVFKNPICEYDCALKRAVAQGCNIHNREYSIKNIEGDLVPIICSTSAFRDNKGQITGGLEIFKDTSDIRELEEEIVRRERKYRRIFEGSHDMIYTTNQPGKILDINPAGFQLLGYSSKAELLEKLDASNLYFNPDDRTKFLAEINQKRQVKDYEADFIKKDGSPLHVLISSRRYENSDTGDIEYEGIIKNITHRKNAEEIIKERNRELSILNKVAVALNHTLDLDHTLKVTLRDVLHVLRLKRGAIFLIDKQYRNIRIGVLKGLPRPDESCSIIFKDHLLEEHLIIKGTSLISKPSFPIFKVGYASSHNDNISWLKCFLITFKGRGVGFFGFDIPSKRKLNAHEIHLLGSLGNFLGGTIENAQLLKMIRQHRQDLRRLTEKLFQSQEDERRHIARELHDEAGQSLTAIKLGLDRLEERHTQNNGNLSDEINEIRKMIKRTASEMRRLSYRLHPTLLVDLGLEPALKLYFQEIMNHSDLDIEFNMVGFNERLDADIETVLYRFSQEALTNTLKHSGAETFCLSIIKSYPRIIFLAEDDGIGFNIKQAKKDRRSLGLLGMRERVSLLGGTLQLRSKPGEGTRIRIEIPLIEESENE